MKKNIIYGALALIIAAGIGYAMPRPSGNKPAETAKTETTPETHSEGEEGHTEAGHEEANGDHKEEKGQVAITPADAQAAGILTGKISFGTGSESRILGRVTTAPEAKVMVGAPVSGRITRVYVAIGSNIKKGAPLFEILSADAASVVADARAASAGANAAQKAYSSDQWLYNKGVISRREMENSLASAQQSSAYANAANAKIAASGNPSSNGSLIIRSPISGIITAMPATIGGFIPQGGMAGEVSDINNLEATFQITPEQAANITIGSNINIETTGNNAGGKQISGIVKAIAPSADLSGATSTLRVKISGANVPVGSTLIGRIITQNGAQNVKPIVPSDAIITLENQKVVFVQNAEGFIAVPVITGQNFNGQTEIIKGLGGNETIVIKNAFLLKSELSSSEGHGH